MMRGNRMEMLVRGLRVLYPKESVDAIISNAVERSFIQENSRDVACAIDTVG